MASVKVGAQHAEPPAPSQSTGALDSDDTVAEGPSNQLAGESRSIEDLLLYRRIQERIDAQHAEPPNPSQSSDALDSDLDSAQGLSNRLAGDSRSIEYLRLYRRVQELERQLEDLQRASAQRDAELIELRHTLGRPKREVTSVQPSIGGDMGPGGIGPHQGRSPSDEPKNPISAATGAGQSPRGRLGHTPVPVIHTISQDRLDELIDIVVELAHSQRGGRKAHS